MIRKLRDFNLLLNSFFFKNCVSYLDFYKSRITKIIDKSDDSFIILHFGSGRDKFKIFNDNQYRNRIIVSLDLNKKTLAMNPNRKKILANGEEIPILNNIVDLIVAEHVFEHIENPDIVIKELNRILKSGGKLIIAVPNKNSYISLIGRLTPNRFHIFTNKLRGIKEAEIDTFPKFYRFNDLKTIFKKSKRYKFKICELLTFTGTADYTIFLPFHIFFIVIHKMLEKVDLLKNFRINIVTVLEKI